VEASSYPPGTIVCPWCGVPSHFTNLVGFGSRGDDGAEWSTNVWRCDACGKPVRGMPVSGGPPSEPGREHWLEPRSRRAPDYPDVPGPIKDVAQEAHRCFGAEAYRGSVTMARRALQQAARDHGAPAGRLIDEIDALATSGKITEPLKDAAHALREGGNDAAHPNGLDPSPEDAGARRGR
jgi:Domain of unknown function (DUF4145)